MHYEVIRGENDAKSVRPVQIRTVREALFSFHLDQLPAKTGREEFDNLLEAALHASKNLGGEEVGWTFNSVPLNTNMQHGPGVWATYTELSAEMAN